MGTYYNPSMSMPPGNPAAYPNNGNYGFVLPPPLPNQVPHNNNNTAFAFGYASPSAPAAYNQPQHSMYGPVPQHPTSSTYLGSNVPYPPTLTHRPPPPPYDYGNPGYQTHQPYAGAGAVVPYYPNQNQYPYTNGSTNPVNSSSNYSYAQAPYYVQEDCYGKKKKGKKFNKKKIMKYGVPIAGVALGAYALNRIF